MELHDRGREIHEDTLLRLGAAGRRAGRGSVAVVQHDIETIEPLARRDEIDGRPMVGVPAEAVPRAASIECVPEVDRGQRYG